jgi:L,D-transpeptidase ErfK/SrfK
MARGDLSRRGLLTGAGALGAVVLAQPRFAFAARYPNLIGEVTTTLTRKGDTLMDVMRRHNLGYVEIVAANPTVDPWIPPEGTKLVLPTAHILPDAPREGLVLNLPEQRLYHFQPGGGQVRTFPIGIGSEGKTTPVGRTTVVRKQKNPTWYVPKSILKEEPDHKKIVPPGPDNPLGRHALYLGWNAYLIHGTNLPDAVGRRASHGCINMYPESVEYLFDRVAIGTPVTVVNQQAKFASIDGALYLQVHASGKQTDQIEATGKFEPEAIPDLAARADKAAGEMRDRIDWDIVVEAVKRRNGIPVRITKDAPA